MAAEMVAAAKVEGLEVAAMAAVMVVVVREAARAAGARVAG